MKNHIRNLEIIFRSALASVDPEKLIENSVSLADNVLEVNSPDLSRSIDLDAYSKIFVTGFGKASAKMAKAVERLLGDRICDGIVAVKYGHTEDLQRIRILEAGHPIPDQKGIRAAIEISKMASAADENTVVINLISGGGSALIPYPFDTHLGDVRYHITLEQKQRVTQLLLSCGAIIDEINCLRKHMSMIKGGRLAKMLYPATSINLILSDVVGDSLDTIASGPTTWDATGFEDVADIIAKYDIAPKLPQRVKEIFRLGLNGKIRDTPSQGDKVFSRSNNFIIGTNYLSLRAARKKAQDLGYTPIILSSQIVGEAREVARVYCGIAKDAKRRSLFGDKPLCLIAGGETTVTLGGDGKGGRNQEMALSFLGEIAQSPEAAEGIYFLAASTDGNDGPTDAAGAFASTEIMAKARKIDLSIPDFLKRNDAYTFFDTLGALLKTGPTNTNVCDIQLTVVT